MKKYFISRSSLTVSLTMTLVLLLLSSCHYRPKTEVDYFVEMLEGHYQVDFTLVKGPNEINVHDLSSDDFVVVRNNLTGQCMVFDMHMYDVGDSWNQHVHDQHFQPITI